MSKISKYFKPINLRAQPPPTQSQPDEQFPCTNQCRLSPNEQPSSSVQVKQVSPIENQIHPKLVMDPGLRKPLHEVAPSLQEKEELRRAYLIACPCQPRLDNFPQTEFSGVNRRFTEYWYNTNGNKEWLEYSEDKRVVFCLCCYLFHAEFGENAGGHDAFVNGGFKNWKKMERLKAHVGDHISIHTRCLMACRDLLNEKQHIDVALKNVTAQDKKEYRICLKASVTCIRYLLLQGESFRGDDESEESSKRGKFLSLLKFHAKPNEEIWRVVMSNAPKNNKMIAPSTQKEIAHACAFLTTRKIIEDIGDEYFSLLVDEARDMSIKEQMAIVLRYVNTHGCIVERFISVVHIAKTTAQSLKEGIDEVFATHGLSMSRLRGQGYDGASNMRGEFKGLKSLILPENNSAFYVHCFAHQLQLALVKVAKNHKILRNFFDYLMSLCNVVGSSCKRKELLRVLQLDAIAEGIACGDLQTGRGLNQETNLQRPGDTRWGSHYATISSVIRLFSPIVKLLKIIDDDPSFESGTEAHTLLINIETFEFIFLLFLMRDVLGISFELSKALQRKDQDIQNAMVLVKIAKKRLQISRETGWDNLLQETSEFCSKNDIEIPNMEDSYVPLGRSRRGLEQITNLRHYKVDIFYTVLDSQLLDLNDRFDNVNTQLIESVACLDPRNSFSSFDKHKLVEFAKLYPSDFNDTNLHALDSQLQTYITDMRMDAEFCNLKGVSELAQKLVEKQRDIIYPLVYLLVKLALILPVATATVERTFSAMSYLKTPLRNRMGDIWLNDLMVTYIERDVFESIEDEDIIKFFEGMKPRRRYCNTKIVETVDTMETDVLNELM